MFSALGAIIGFIFVPSVIDATMRFFYLPMNVNFIIGVGIGSLLSAAKVLVLEKIVDKALSHSDAQKAKIYMHLSYMPRLLFTAGTLFLSVYFFGMFGILGAVVGNLSLTLSAYLIKFLNHKQSKSRRKE